MVTRPPDFAARRGSIRAAGAAAIALAVAAEIHAALNGRDGRPLTMRTQDRQNQA